MIKNISNLGDSALYCDFGKEINKEIEGQVNSLEALEGLQMPKLTDNNKLFEIELNEKNIQHTDKSKVDGTTI